MTTNRATRALNEEFPRGTLVRFLDDARAFRLGVVKGAKGGVLHVVSPPDYNRRSARVGLTAAIVRAIQRTFKVPRERVCDRL